MHELRVRRIVDVVHGNEVGAFGADERISGAIHLGRGDTFDLHALLLGALIVVQAVADGQILHGVAGIPGDLATGVEDGPAAGAALPIALVGRGHVVIVDPRDGIRLARSLWQGIGGVDELVGLGVHPLDLSAACAEHVRNAVGLQVDDGHTVVFLQSDG